MPMIRCPNRHAIVVTGAGTGSGNTYSITKSPGPCDCSGLLSARGRTLHMPGTGSQRYSASVIPSNRGRRWSRQCQSSCSKSCLFQSIVIASRYGPMRTESFLDSWLTCPMDTASRLLKLLSLLPARREWTGADLARRLEITDRTLRRDVARLRSLGYPIYATPGAAGGYRLGAGGAMPPLLLDDDEAVAVAVGLRSAAGGTVAGIEETSVRALAKLEQVLPAKLRQRVSSMVSVMVQMPGGGPPVDPEMLVRIAGACRDPRRLHFSYERHDGTPSDRSVEPHRLVHTGRRWYLVARDIDRDDWRTFRVDRIAPPVMLGATFTPPTDPPDAVRFVSNAVSASPYRYRAVVTLYAPAADIAARVPPTVGQVEAIDVDSCRLITGSDSLLSVVVHLSALDVDFEVTEPAEMVDVIRTLAARLTRAAQRSGG